MSDPLAAIGRIGEPLRQLIAQLQTGPAAWLQAEPATVRLQRQWQLAADLATLLTASPKMLNRRAALIVRCPGGRPAYRVFRIPNVGLLGVPAREEWLNGGWKTVPEWLADVDRPVPPRCRCHRELPTLNAAALTRMAAAGQRSVTIPPVR